MRRRLDLAASLVVQPQVLFLDEPTTGLDPRSRQAMWAMIEELVEGGMTVFLTTQYLDEADRLADRVAVIDDGRVVAQGSPAELKRDVGGPRLELTLANRAAYARAEELLRAVTLQRDTDRLWLGVSTRGSAAEVRTLLDSIDPDRDAVVSFDVKSATLDDVFLALTGHAADTGAPTADQEALRCLTP
jgi:ABC-2 type transport system ATP-binding protein